MNAPLGLDLVRSLTDVSRETEQRLTVFHDLLVKWQASINLIADSTKEQIWQRHIADSVFCVLQARNHTHIVDIGSGAGFPGIIHAIMLADPLLCREQGKKQVHLVESNGKKCAFLNAAIRETKVRQEGVAVSVHNGRIENVLPNLEQPELITARALASLNDLLGLTDCFASQGSVLLLPKGREHSAEIGQAKENWVFDHEIIENPLGEDSVVIRIKYLKRR